MKLNISLKEFKKKHLRKKNQIIFYSRKCNDYKKIENLYKFILAEKNSFIFESVEKGQIKGRFTIIGFNPDKIWDVNNNKILLNDFKRKKVIKDNPLKFINNLLKNFKLDIPKQLPSMSSMLVGYFSYDVIRLIEKIPNKCKDDLRIPDIRISRPRNLIIYDNVLKKIYYIENIFSDTKITNYNSVYSEIINKFLLLEKYENINLPEQITYKRNNNLIKSNISKKGFKSLVIKAKRYIKQGDIFQVVLSQRFERKIYKRPLEIYNYLRKSNPSPFMFFF